MPGSIATLTERKNEARGQQCLAALEARGRRHGLNLTGLLTLSAPAAAPPHATEAAAAGHTAQEAATAASPRASQRNTTAGEVDLRALEMAVDAAVDETAGALKASARHVAVTMAARSKGKKKAPRPDRLARRALAQALKSNGGPCSDEEGESNEQPNRHAKGHVKARGSPSEVTPEREEPKAKGGHGKKRRGKGNGGRGMGVKNSPETFFKKG